MELRVGTSGYSFPAWKGVFYPEKLPAKKMLGYYSEQLPTVEINNTFYRLPKPEVVQSWKDQVPESFRFVLKASQRITHQRRLKVECAESLEFFLSSASVLEEQLGALLFQLPPNMKKNAERLRDFLELLPEGTRAAFEFRNATWFEDAEMADMLAARDMALVVADTEEDHEEEKEPDLTHGASWGYLRLRRDAYTEEDLLLWRERLDGTSWSEIYVFLKHEVEGPAYASQILGKG